MGVGTADGRSGIAKHYRCDAAILYYTPLVIGSDGGAVAGKLDSIRVGQLALNNVGALHLVVYSLRLFVSPGIKKWRWSTLTS